MKRKAKKLFGVFYLILGSIGIVFGDLATSPLYIFSAIYTGEPTEIDILGALSLIIYSVITIVTVKYVIFIMALDNDGEGGVFALAALVPDWKWDKKGTLTSKLKYVTKRSCIYLSIVCASFVLGDSVITPPISVLSALEGIETAAPSFQPIVVPLAVIILILLFLGQRLGTSKVGMLLGPIMLLWAATLSALGIYNITLNPRALLAFNPAYGYFFFQKNGTQGFEMFAGVVLCITGVEAMYADMGHFGKLPIRVGWIVFVFPSVILSYIGQSAYLMNNPSGWQGAFYASVPGPVYWPVLVLATLATIIASQAMITGAFSLISQAVALGYFPRVKIVHTSKAHEGQIFIPMINIFLLIMCVALVIAFQSSSRLASAYGLAVCGVLVLTTIIYMIVVIITWKCYLVLRILYLIPFTVLFMPIQAFFFAANASKFITGGWLPFVIGIAFTIIMVIWFWGSENLRKINHNDVVLSFEDFRRKTEMLKRVKGVGVFFVNSSHGVPRYLTKFTKTLSTLPEIVVFVSVKYYKVPFVSEKHRMSVYMIHDNMFRIVARYGFFEKKVVLPQVIDMAIKKYKFQVPEVSITEDELPSPISSPDSTLRPSIDTSVRPSTDTTYRPSLDVIDNPQHMVKEKNTNIELPNITLDEMKDLNESALDLVEKKDDNPEEQVPKEPRLVSLTTPSQDSSNPELKKDYKFYARKVWAWLSKKSDEEKFDTKMDINYFLPRDTVMVDKKKWWFWRYPTMLFVFMLRNSRDETRRLQISADRVFEVGNVVYL
jgi:KUP system potassium uptake protein